MCKGTVCYNIGRKEGGIYNIIMSTHNQVMNQPSEGIILRYIILCNIVNVSFKETIIYSILIFEIYAALKRAFYSVDGVVASAFFDTLNPTDDR